MKKIFTLVAGLLLIGSTAFAQSSWKDLVVNGSMEGGLDEMWSSFWCHDWRQGVSFNPESGQRYDDPAANATVDDPPCQFQGFAEIVEDPTTPGNHCARVVIRTKEEGHATGTYTFDTNNNKPEWCEWDSQFFIYANEAIPEGKDVRLVMRVRGEKAGTLQTQAHWTPGDYNHYQLFGDISYTTEWKTIDVTATVDANHTQSGNGKEFKSVAFNLSTMEDGNTVYFDDIKLLVKDPEEMKEFEAWYNFLSNGTLSDNYIYNNGTRTNYTSFTARNGIDGVDRPATIVNDPTDGQPAIMISTVAYEGSYDEPVLDDDGNPQIDDETGEPKINTVNYWTKKFTNADGSVKDSTMTRAIDDWESQFFVSIPHKFKVGEKYRVKYSVRADKPTSLDSQAHTNPGGYIHWAFIGSPELTEEWQEFEVEGEIASEQKGAWTIAFNCNKGKDETNNIYFRFDEFSINSAEVKDLDRVIGTVDVVGELPEKGADATKMKVDLTEALATLGATSVEDLFNGFKVCEQDIDGNLLWLEVQPDFLVDATGNPTESTTGINLAYNEDESEGNIASFDIYNDLDVNASVPVRVMFTKYEDSAADDLHALRAWSYLLNINLMGHEAYQEYAGVSDLTVAKANNGAIYDLTGRRVAKASKGLYIKDGKKFFLK